MDLDHIESAQIRQKFRHYPDNVRQKLLLLRSLIVQTAVETEGVADLEETLKWGEPSYRSNIGSTVRINWKASSPDRYFMYFHCQTRLVDTFRELYGDRFDFDGNRAIEFQLDDVIAVEELKHCIALTLTYHKVKHLPLLGA
jgi:hypothetical protein